MTKGIKTKPAQKTKSRILVLGFILLILAGLFSPMGQARAANCTNNDNTLPAGCTPVNWTPYQMCANADIAAGHGDRVVTDCQGKSGAPDLNQTITCYVNGTPQQMTSADCATKGGTPAPGAGSPADSALQANIKSCAFLTGSFDGCIEKLFFYVLYGIPNLLLVVAAKLFNAMVGITLSSALFLTSTFIPKAWGVVRDLANIFFIFILLITAIKIIVGSGEHDAKKTVIKVIFIALIINFSMFFTEVVIDSSNALALVFYNKLDVCTTVVGQTTPGCAPYIPTTSSQERDLSGAMVKAFDPSQFLSQGFFDKLKNQTQAVPSSLLSASTLVTAAKFIAFPIYSIPRAIYGYWFPSNDVPTPIILGVIVMSGLIMAFAAYAFFMGALSFLSVFVERMILVIFSPFAMMSSTTSMLDDVDYIGWKAWLKRLVAVATMPPIFMLFLYFIFLLLASNIFNEIAITQNRADIGSIETIILVVIPALVILTLLMKAAHYAKKASGALGEVIIKGTEIAMGLVAGVGFGVAAKGLQMTAGQAASRLANSERLKQAESRGVLGAGILRSAAKYGAKSSFDVRQGVAGGVLAAAGSVSGLNLGHSSKFFKESGGFEADRKRKIEARVARAKELELGESSTQRQAVRQRENELAEAKSNPEVQARLVRLDEGNHDDENTAKTALATANSAAVDPAVQSLINAQQTAQGDLAAADRALAVNPTDVVLQTAQKTAADQLDAANNALATAQTLARNQAVAQERLDAAEATLALDPHNHDLEVARDDARNNLTNATNDASGNAAAQAMLAKETAMVQLAAAQGLGPLTRAAADGERGLADATRKLDDTVKKYGANSLEATNARAKQAEALAERERTRINLANREADKRGAGGGIHRAEVALKQAQNAVIGANNATRLSYARVVQTGILPSLDFLNAGGRWAAGGTAQEEAADKIRAGVQAEQKIPSAH